MDVLCGEDLDLYGRDIDDPLQELDQDLYHRLIETHGSNLDDLDRGVGVGSMLSGTLDGNTIAARIEADFLKDDRVKAVRATVSTVGKTTRINVQVQANEGTLGIVLEADGAGGVKRVS